MRKRARTMACLSTVLIAIGALVSCSSDTSSTGPDGSGGSGGSSPSTLTVVAHDSFVLPEELKKAFEDESGLKLKVISSGDAGKLATKLVLTKDSPTGDVAFGVDNTFASRPLKAGVFVGGSAATLPAGAEDFRLRGDTAQALSPIDTANVCLNVDTTWFATRKLDPPATLEDLLKPAYKDLAVIPGAATSSPGMAFLLTTIAAEGKDWPAYWEKLMANGAELTQGWTDAYQVDFTAGGGHGTRPIVVSYDSSPAFTVADGTTSTAALLDTCFTQVEYAGILTGAKNPQGAQEFIDFLLSAPVQRALPEAMYVYPVLAGTPLPTDWARYTKRPSTPWTVAPDTIDVERDQWLRTWADVTSR